MASQICFISLLTIGLCVAHGKAQAQPSVDDPRSYFAPLVAAERGIADVPPEVYKKPRAVEVAKIANGFGRQLQRLGTMRADAGDTDGAIAAFDLLQWPSATPASKAAVLAQLADMQTEDAVQAIVAQALTKRVVLLNEAHHVPMHRAFAQRLAAALRKIGYTYLACETFNENTPGDARPPVPGQTVFGTGTYTKESGFAGFVNAALADGWNLVAYEHNGKPQPGADPMQQMREREEGQARNLIERVFDKDKKAKVFIYVGYSHLHKAKPNDPIVWMSEYLQRSTGLSMLRVDQTTFYAHPDHDAEDPLYGDVVAKFALPAPFVLRIKDGSYPVLGRDQGRVDMQVIFPRYAAHHGRPDWLGALAGRMPREIPTELLPKQGRRVIKAFRMDAAPDAVPLDVVLVQAGTPIPSLMLPPGEFRYAYEDEPSSPSPKQ